jgi:hypothetical protein
MLADIMERADVRVVQPGDGLRLTLEPGAAIRVGAQLGGQHFDGHTAVEPRVLRLVDLAHPARADGGLNLIGSQPGSW